VLRRHINKISSIQLGPWWEFLIKFFVPLVLSIILMGDLYNELKQPYEGYSWTSLILIGRDWVLLTFIIALILAMRPWKTERHKTGGRIDGTESGHV
jgi:NSS family neurotransmitter:Na+ symporter